MGGVLVMEQLHYAAELRSAADVPIPDVPVKEGELALARQLIEQTATDEFHPEKYHDTVRDRVLEAIQQKVEGQEITAETTEQPETKIIDLMEALKASLSKKSAASAEKKSAKSSSSDAKPAKKRASKAS
jgi:DNA end-binding protein Ku